MTTRRTPPPRPARDPLAERFERLVAARPPRAASLVVSVFGDVVVPHGGAVALGTLIRWLAPFGIADRAVRTAVQRLAGDDWFASRARGRRADYVLTETSRHRFADAERRIYAAEPLPWDGIWTVVVLGPGSVETDRRDAVRRELRWHGFGELAPTVLLHPRADLDELALALRDLGVERSAIVLRATAETRLAATGAPLLELVPAAWDLRDLERAYREYVGRFGALLAALDHEPAPELAFRIRVYAIHEYRRVLLRDPELPAELLPESWAGAEARRLCAAVYHAVEESARRFVVSSGETAAAPLPPAEPSYFARFGGLAARSRRGATAAL